MKILIASILMSLLLLQGCTESNLELAPVEAEGRLYTLEVSAFMYGTHMLKNREGELVFALKSSSLNLDAYLAKEVQIKGVPIEGYPLEGGPVYLEVTQVDVLSE